MNVIFLLLTGVVVVIVVWAALEYRAFARKMEAHRAEEAKHKENVRAFITQKAALRAEELREKKIKDVDLGAEEDEFIEGKNRLIGVEVTR